MGLRIRGPGGETRRLSSQEARQVSPPQQEALQAEAAEAKPEQPAETAAENREARIIDAAGRFVEKSRREAVIAKAQAEAASRDVEAIQQSVDRFADNPAVAERIGALLQQKRAEAQAAGTRSEAKRANRESEQFEKFLKSEFRGQDPKKLEAKAADLLADLKSKQEIPRNQRDSNIVAEMRKIDKQLDGIQDYLRARRMVERRVAMLEEASPAEEAERLAA